MSRAFTPITRSLLERDLYKATMQQAMLHQMPENTARYFFNCRNTPLIPLSKIAREVNEQLDHLCDMRYTGDELAALAKLRFIKPDFIEFLAGFQLDRSAITARADSDHLSIEAVGRQVDVTDFELYVLPIVQETYTRQFETRAVMADMRQRLDYSIDRALARLKAMGPGQKPFELFDFGLRRRWSAAWHDTVLSILMERMPEYLKGTSDIYLANKLGLTPIGTMAHEYLQTFQAMPGVTLRDSIKAALQCWIDEYQGDLGIALTDVITTDAFLRDFSPELGGSYTGARQDSGDPMAWAQKMLAHYRSQGQDAYSKRLVFSDSLTLDTTALDLYEALSVRDKCTTGFGIGTSLTNNGPIPALNLVMKLHECNGRPTAKISDAAGKTQCLNTDYVEHLKTTFGVA